MRREILAALNSERETRRAAIVVTDLATGAQEFIPAADAGKHQARAAFDRTAASRQERQDGRSMGAICFCSCKFPAAG